MQQTARNSLNIVNLRTKKSPPAALITTETKAMIWATQTCFTSFPQM